MPRRTASDRFSDLPVRPWPPKTESHLIEAIVAISHPLRRALHDALEAGPADVGTLARRVGIAPGSASHHLEALASAGWIALAREAAPDTRHTVWRSLHRTLTWRSDDFSPGSRGRRIVEDLNVTNVNASHDILLRALAAEPPHPSTTISDWHAEASDDQCADLNRRLLALMNEWRAEVMASPEADRIPRRIVMWQAPSVG